MFKQIITGCLFFVAGIVIFGSFYTVKSGNRALVFTFGKVVNVESDGLHFKIPIVQTIEKVSILTLKAHSPASAGTKDMQNVTTEVALNYHRNYEQLMEMYKKCGLNVEETIIDPRIMEVVKAVVAIYSAEELLMKREIIKNEIANRLKVMLTEYYIVTEDIQITNFQFSDAFMHSIEAKQIAEQDALKANNDLQRIKIEKLQKITQAEAEAQTIKIQSEAIKAQGGSEYLTLKWIEKWNGQVPTYISSGKDFLMINPKQ